MNIDELLSRLKQASVTPGVPRQTVVGALEAALNWLNQHNTDENCRDVDTFVATHLIGSETEHLPKDIKDILFDVGATLHDTRTAPNVAENFDSTPSQLLERVRKLPASE
jgi:hypothetical protein